MRRRPGTKRRRGCLVIVCLATAIAIFLYGRINYLAQPYCSWDLKCYRDIAAASPGIDPSIPGPFAFRLLGPYVVGLLPIPDPLAFYILACITSLVLAGSFYGFLRYWGLRSEAAALTVVLFVFSKWMLGYTVWDYFQINDLLSLVYVLALVSALHKRAWVAFGLTMVVGALTRETSLLMIPVALVYLAEKRTLRQDWWKAVLASLPGASCFVLLRLLIHPPEQITLIAGFLKYWHKLASLDTWLRLLIVAFIPVSLVPLVFWRETVGFCKTNKHLLVLGVLVLASTMFAENNERLMAPAFLSFYPLIGTIIDRHLSRSRPTLWLLVAGSLASTFHHRMGRYLLPGNRVTMAMSLGSLFVVTIAAFMLRRSETRKQSNSGKGSARRASVARGEDW